MSCNFRKGTEHVMLWDELENNCATLANKLPFFISTLCQITKNFTDKDISQMSLYIPIWEVFRDVNANLA
jgi:hypothetical protein